jgi:hypothetical protein
VVGRLASRHAIKVRLRRSWFGGVAALVLLPSALLGGPETDMEPARRAAAAKPADGQPAAAPATRNGPMPRAFAVRSPGTGRDNGTAG